jgi:hypothetical protein
MHYAGILLIVLGVLLVSLGVIALWTSRGGETDPDAGTSASGVSRPTRMVIALVFSIIGYHLIVWAFPRSLTMLQWPRSTWYIPLIAGVAAITSSLWLDRFERRRDGWRPGQGTPSRPGESETPEEHRP